MNQFMYLDVGINVTFDAQVQKKEKSSVLFVEEMKLKVVFQVQEIRLLNQR